MASGDDESLEKSKSVLDALARELFVIKGGAGQGSMVKCVHQLLAGVHICAAAEAMGTFVLAELLFLLPCAYRYFYSLLFGSYGRKSWT
jgi:putative dehydrogenase